MPIRHLPPLPAERARRERKLVILYNLFDGEKRLSELSRKLPEISQKMLIQQLREMEENGLVYRQVPPRVDYSAPTLELSLAPVLQAPCDWDAGTPLN